MYPAFLVSLSRYRDQAAESVKSGDLFSTDSLTEREMLKLYASAVRRPHLEVKGHVFFSRCMDGKKIWRQCISALNLRNPATKQSLSAFLCCTVSEIKPSIYQNSCLNLRAPVAIW